MVTFKNLGPGRVTATFHFPATIWTESVHLVIDIDGAGSSASPMIYSRSDDAWQVTLILEENKTYHYSYLLDGQQRCQDQEGTIIVPGSACPEEAPPLRWATLLPVLVAEGVEQRAG
jgi:hypothetical protein